MKGRVRVVVWAGVLLSTLGTGMAQGVETPPEERLLGAGGPPVRLSEGIEGYLGARLGMDVAGVKATFAADAIELLKEEGVGGDTMLQARREAGEERQKLIYGFTGPDQRLALINVFHPGRKAEDRLLLELSMAHGPALPIRKGKSGEEQGAAQLAESLAAASTEGGEGAAGNPMAGLSGLVQGFDPGREALERDFGAPVQAIDMWMAHGGTQGRFIKFVRFPRFMVVQYYDSGLLELAR